MNPDAQEFRPALGFNFGASESTPFSEISLRPEAAEFIPMLGGWVTLQVAADAYHQYKQEQLTEPQQRPKRQIPNASDQEWEQRTGKREKEVQTIKSMQSYRLYVEVFPQDHREDDDPKTPDPFDRSISKRQWKWNVEKWRLQLKSRCVYSRAVMLQCRQYAVDNGEPLSTDGCCKEEGRTPLRMESMDTLRTASTAAEVVETTDLGGLRRSSSKPRATSVRFQ